MFYCFVRSGSCERGICARSVSLDLAQGVLALSSLSADLASWLFYCAGFGFYRFSCQVGPSYFIIFTPFQFSFLVAIC